MRSSLRRAVVAAGAVAVVLGTGAGVASAAPMPVLVWSPTSVDFGRLTTPGATASQVFTLKNTGGAGSSALTITAAPPYTTSRDTCTGTSLGPGKSCTVTVTFTAPATPGTYPGTLTATASLAHVGATAPLTGQSGKIIPAISTAPQPAIALTGTTVADSATVTGPAGDTPTGTVTFTLYNNSTCNGGVLFTDTEGLSNTGTATSANYTASAGGIDYWQATYNSDGNNSSVTSTCGEQLTVSDCLITDTSANPPQAFTDLSPAIIHAKDGDTLIIEGECNGGIVPKSLTLTGQAAAAFTHPTVSLINGNVLTINSNTNVSLNNLTITGGDTITGGGILNHGNLTVSGVTITHNSAVYGGGIYNDGTVNFNSGTIGGSTSSGANTATEGGGIYNASGGTVNFSGTIGGGITSGGNTATDGGGIYNASGGTLNLYSGLIGNSLGTLGGNTASQHGGGIYNGGKLTQSGAAVTFNTAGAIGDGGGLFEACGSTNTGIAFPPTTDPNVTNNSPDNVAIGNCP